MASAARPFDRVASQYDEMWTDSLVGSLQRKAVWRVVDPLFSPGERIVDVGCGTGADAAHLARRGVRVHATDISPEMVRITRARVQKENLACFVTTGVLALEALREQNSFDGALLNFGVLNCVEDLRATAQSLAIALRPDARIALCFMGRFCLWETVWHGLRFNLAKATRRWGGGPVMATLDGSEFPVYYPSLAEIRAAFQPHFRLVQRQGIGVFVPFTRALPRAGRFLAHLDRNLAQWPGLRAMGDHQLVTLVRNPSKSSPRLIHPAPEVDGIARALAPERRSVYARFLDDYSRIRREEGRGAADPAYYLALPYQDLSGKHSDQWFIRARSYRYFERHLLPAFEHSPHPWRTLSARRVHTRVESCDPKLNILDLGAGNGWLSYRLSLRGHSPVAVDMLTDPLDGLGAARHFFSCTQFPLYEAEFDRLPFADGQFDLAIFNSSFHYSTNYRRTLLEAKRCLRPSGRVVIIDSPVYSRPEHGEQMRRERHEQFERQYGFRSDSIPSIEYLDEPTLAALSRDLGIQWQVYRPWYGWRWHMRPWKARLKGRRPPSRFWILVGSFSNS